MKHFRPCCLTLFLLAFGVSAALSQGNWNNALHKTRNGKNYWYGTANGGFESFTGVPVSAVGCVECHGPTDADGNPYPTPYAPGCIDCHPSNSAFNPDSIKVTQCLSCHSRQKTESTTLAYRDVHRDRNFKCWDCHTANDMHGTTTAYSSMLEPGAMEVDCEDCHTTAGGTLPDHSAWNPGSHQNKIHCTACHARTVISCYNCHFESQVQTQLKRAKQTIHDFVILANRDKDGKVYPMSFQSLTYQGTAYTAFGPFTSHTITDTGRVCADCHVNFGGTNASILEYNATGEIAFARWNPADSTLSWKKKIVPMPADYRRSFKMDFLTYNGSVSDPVVSSKNWSYIGKNTWDGHQMFFATPLTKTQMAKLGFDTTLTTDVNIERGGGIPAEFELKQNYPNPFNPSTTIAFSVQRKENVRLEVFNAIGQSVALLVNREMEAGNYTATWHGTDNDGRTATSGLYLVRMQSENFSAVRKMLLVK